MRKVLLIMLAFCFLWSIARANGEFGPTSFDSWKTIKEWGLGPHPRKIFRAVINPNPNHPVKLVLLRVGLIKRPHDWRITGYAYHKDGELFVYQVTEKSYYTKEWHFERITPGPEDATTIGNRLEKAKRLANSPESN